jgi:ribose transport system ATP-binding protein
MIAPEKEPETQRCGGKQGGSVLEGQNNATILSAFRISKRFQATLALKDVTLHIGASAIHTLVGENGAGKSTLIKILSGVYRPDHGEILLDGQPQFYASPAQARKAGVVVIPQELRIVPAFSVAENVTLGAWPERRKLGLIPAIDKRAMDEMAQAALSRLNVNFDLHARADSLSFAERQMVVIARALLHEARVLILDEPTASLESREAEKLFGIIESLKSSGVAIVYVSHRLDEIVRLSDRCTVLRDGQAVCELAKGSIDKEELIRQMTGRDLEELHRPHSAELGPPILETHHSGAQQETDHLKVRKGEVVGLAGLLGSGTTHFLHQLYGAAGNAKEISVNGIRHKMRRPKDAIRAGLGMVPGERALGLVMSLSVRDNMLLPCLDSIGGGWRLDGKAMDMLARNLIDLLDIRPRDLHRPVRDLSGGNQQKVIFARWLAAKASLLLLDEPTHGIDVAAKARIHRLMREFVENGGGIVFASSEMIEVMAMSDTVLAMRHGERVGTMSRQSAEYSERNLRLALGG